MRHLFAAIGIDFDQWKALTLTAVKLDFRVTALGQRQFGREARAVAGLVFQAVFYTLFGAFIAFFVWASRDLFLVGTVAATYTAFVIGTAVILDHNSVIASPADYAILGFRPVSSRTYFAVKLTNILIYTMTLTTAAAWLPVLSAFLRHGWPVGVAMGLNVYGSSMSTTLVIAFGYASVLRAVGPDAIERALSYVQFAMSFAVYGGQFVLSGLVSRTVVSSFRMPDTSWLFLYPGTWFGSYLEVAAGQASTRAIMLAGLSVVLLVVTASQLGGRLSMDYSERLGAITASARVQKRPRRSGRVAFWFARDEARAVALLVRSQFRHDHRFRMGVLGLLPFTIFYVWMGVRNGAIADPFSPGAGMQAWPVTLSVLMSPSMLSMLLTRSDSYRASWIFFTTPADRMQIARASKNVLVTFFLIPYLLLVFALYTYVVGHPGHVLVHFAFLGLVGHLVLQLAVLIDPSLPFSKPMGRTRGSTIYFGFTMATIAVSAIIQFFSSRLYRSAMSMVVAATFIVLAGMAIDRLTRARVARQTRLLEFED